MSDLSSMLSGLYRSGVASEASLEKTAEANLLSELRGEDSTKVSEQSFSEMSTADLYAHIQRLEAAGGEKVASANDEAALGELEKTAQEMLGGQVMAHAMVHEFSLIKTAMAQGLCRVCKENAMDVTGSSICSTCASE